MNFTSVSGEQAEVERNKRYIPRLVSFYSNLYGFSFHIKVLLYFHKKELLVFFCPLFSYALSLHVCSRKTYLLKSKHRKLNQELIIGFVVFSRGHEPRNAIIWLRWFFTRLCCCSCCLAFSPYCFAASVIRGFFSRPALSNCTVRHKKYYLKHFIICVTEICMHVIYISCLNALLQSDNTKASCRVRLRARRKPFARSSGRDTSSQRRIGPGLYELLVS